MTRVICDNCRKESTLGNYGLSPDGWVSVTYRGDYSPDGGGDYCSASCAASAVAGRALKVAEQVHVAPAAVA